MISVFDNPADLFKQCELRRFGADGKVERRTHWIPADDAVVGREIPCGDDGWEIVSAPDPALPGRAIQLFESAAELVRLA